MGGIDWLYTDYPDRELVDNHVEFLELHEVSNEHSNSAEHQEYREKFMLLQRKLTKLNLARSQTWGSSHSRVRKDPEIMFTSWSEANEEAKKLLASLGRLDWDVTFMINKAALIEERQTLTAIATVDLLDVDEARRMFLLRDRIVRDELHRPSPQSIVITTIMLAEYEAYRERTDIKPPLMACDDF